MRLRLVMHNERLADPLDEFTRAIAAISKKRNKTEADHLAIGREEFLGGLYMNGNGRCMPAWNILRCLQDGAKRQKRGVDVLRGVYPMDEHADVRYEGDTERDPEELWKLGENTLRKTVGIQRSRTMRTRPIFTDWQGELAVEVDPVIFDVDTLGGCWKESGRTRASGDAPVNGRFLGTGRGRVMTAELARSLDRIAIATSILRTRGADEERREVNGGEPRELTARVEAVISRLEKAAADLEAAIK